MQPTTFDLPRALFQILSLGILIGASLWIISPFLVAITWATTIVVATWPLLLGLEGLVGGRRGVAAAVMTLALLMLLIVPLAFGIDALLSNTDEIVEWAKSLGTVSIPSPPGWVASLPVFGEKIAERWHEAAALSTDELTATLTPYGQAAALWVVAHVGSLGMLLAHFLLTVVVSGILYSHGETAERGVRRFAHRLAGERGENAVILAGQAIRGVALGVVVTAVLQTTLVGIGLTVAGVPFATLLIALTFVLCIAQVGPFLVMIPVTIWIWSTYGSAWGAGFLVWSLLCGLLDNVVRPVLIRRGADLPLLLIFSGVIGGLLAMGIVGLFVGPVVLAVSYTLLREWVTEGSNFVVPGKV